MASYDMGQVQYDPQQVRRQRRAEKLRREYERVGDEQNLIFESLAEYTHGVQADVRALQIERDQLITTDSTLTAAHRRSGEREPDHPAQAAGSAASTASITAAILHHDSATAVRVASPSCLDNLWVPGELATLGVVVCACLGAVLGISMRRNSGHRNNNGQLKGGKNVHESATAVPHPRGVGNVVVSSASSTSKDHLSWNCTRRHGKKRRQEHKRRSTIVKRHGECVTDPHVHQD